MPYRLVAHYEGEIKEAFITNRTEAVRQRKISVRNGGAYYAAVIDLVSGEEFGEGMKPYTIVTLMTEEDRVYVLDQSNMTWQQITPEYVTTGKMLTLPVVKDGQHVLILVPPDDTITGRVGYIFTPKVLRHFREYQPRTVRSNSAPSRLYTPRQIALLERLPKSEVLSEDSEKASA